jgi:hypothetical protein
MIGGSIGQSSQSPAVERQSCLRAYLISSGSVLNRGRCTLYRRAADQLAEIEEAIEIAEKIDISSLTQSLW